MVWTLWNKSIQVHWAVEEGGRTEMTLSIFSLKNYMRKSRQSSRRVELHTWVASSYPACPSPHTPTHTHRLLYLTQLSGFIHQLYPGRKGSGVSSRPLFGGRWPRLKEKNDLDSGHGIISFGLCLHSPIIPLQWAAVSNSTPTQALDLLYKITFRKHYT